MTKRFFFLKSSEPTLNKSHVLHVLSFFFPTTGHSYDNHLDNHCHPTDGDDERPHLRHTHTNTWGRREWWRLRGKGMGMGGESRRGDRRGIWVTVGARDASRALGKLYIYISFLNYLNFFFVLATTITSINSTTTTTIVTTAYQPLQPTFNPVNVSNLA